MLKVKKDLVIAQINEKAETGHEVTKVFTSSHSNIVTRIGCSCGNQHPVFKQGDNFQVTWTRNLEKVS